MSHFQERPFHAWYYDLYLILARLESFDSVPNTFRSDILLSLTFSILSQRFHWLVKYSFDCFVAVKHQTCFELSIKKRAFNSPAKADLNRLVSSFSLMTCAVLCIICTDAEHLHFNHILKSTVSARLVKKKCTSTLTSLDIPLHQDLEEVDNMIESWRGGWFVRLRSIRAVVWLP